MKCVYWGVSNDLPLTFEPNSQRAHGLVLPALRGFVPRNVRRGRAPHRSDRRSLSATSACIIWHTFFFPSFHPDARKSSCVRALRKRAAVKFLACVCVNNNNPNSRSKNRHMWNTGVAACECFVVRKKIFEVYHLISWCFGVQQQKGNINNSGIKHGDPCNKEACYPNLTFKKKLIQTSDSKKKFWRR